MCRVFRLSAVYTPAPDIDGNSRGFNPDSRIVDGISVVESCALTLLGSTYRKPNFASSIRVLSTFKSFVDCDIVACVAMVPPMVLDGPVLRVVVE